MKKKLLLSLILSLVSFSLAWADSKSNREQVNIDQSVGAGYTLQPGKMYIVRSSMTLTATSGSGLNVAPKGPEQQAPILYIPADVTVTVKGADATGRSGAGAGIYVPSGAELIITGAGTLNATGGNAANGGNGENGQNGGNSDLVTKDLQQVDFNLGSSGAGGKGGDGGGGAGAGIGGIGGQGGAGGLGGAAKSFTVGSKTEKKSGENGKDGENGSAGVAMGKVYVMGTVTVTAIAGNAGNAGGAGGTQGYSAYHEYDDAWNVAGAGGGGAGGGAGYAAPYGIGAGGRGAGGGAGGGSGSVDWNLNTSINKPTKNNSSGRASSATGVGKGDQNGAEGTTPRTPDTGYAGIGLYQETGGKGATKGGEAGAVATTADNGSLYVAANAHVTGGTKNSETPPSDMQITITFVNNEFDTDGAPVGSQQNVGEIINATIGDPLPDALASTYKLSAPSKYFAGYYSADKGLGTRIYKGIGTGNLDKAVNAVPFPQDVTLYAHFSHNQHRVNWDYSYDNNGTITEINEPDRIQYGKLVFKFRDGTQDYRILYAKPIIDKQPFTVPSGGTYPLAGHLVSSGEITLTGNGGETSSTTINLTDAAISEEPHKATFTINLTDDQLAQFVSYEFVPMTNATDVASQNWIKTTNADGHTTTFSFVGNTPTKSFPLKWTVTLSDLEAYPEAIFAQPMYFTSSSQWAVISQTAHTLGVECAMTPVGDTPTFGSGSSRTYTFSYPVWQEDNESQVYQYKLGLTGFRLDGRTYYLNATQNKIPLEHYISSGADIVTYTSYSATDASKNDRIEMSLGRNDIPVLRLELNDDNTNTATLVDGVYPIIVTTYGGKIDAPNTHYKATRPGYTFKGWADSKDATEKSTVYDGDLTPYQTTKTVYAVWAENVKPVINTKEIKYNNDGATIVVTVTDNISTPAEGLKVYSYVSNDAVANPEDIDEWTEVTLRTDNDYNVVITGKSTAWVYVKAEDAAKNKEYQSSPSAIKIDGIAPTYEIYPEGNVCNFDCKITVKDNIKLSALYIKKASADNWGTAVAWTGSTDKEKTYTLTKPTDTGEGNGEGEYSLKVVDEAGNEYIYENFVNMYYNHAWNESKAHTVKQKNNDGTFTTYTYYECDHECGHVWVENKTVGGTTFGKPNTAEDGKSGYSQTSGLGNAEAKQYQEQGLMRENTHELFDNTGSVVITNKDGNAVAVTHTLNDAITEAANSANNVITLYDDANVDDGTVAAFPDASTLTNAVTIDLNGYGLKVNGADATGDGITGNEDVIILLKDNGETPYTNKSPVTGSPIKYHRTFAASTRAGNWQALYLPFAAGAVAAPQDVTYTFGTAQSVEITNTGAKLVIEKQDSPNLAAEELYFVKSSNGEIDITANTTLQAAPETVKSKTVSTNYTMTGSYKASDNEATAEQSYWVLTNGGKFIEAAVGSHQRPYHWVIYNNNSSGGSNFRSLTIVEVESNPSAIESVADETILSGEIYSISGQRMPANATLPAGLYVRNGKKFSVK